MKIGITKQIHKDYIDFWVGFYYNRKKKRLYIGIIPLIFGFWIEWGNAPNLEKKENEK